MKYIEKGDETRVWYIRDTEDDVEYKLILNSQFSISKDPKFMMVKELVDDMNDKIEDFRDWFAQLVDRYVEDDYNSEILLESAEDFVHCARFYVDLLNMDFSKFVDKSRISKTSIVFDEGDLREIIITSTAIKLYFIFAASVKKYFDKDRDGEEEDGRGYIILRPTDEINDKIMAIILDGCVKRGIHDKLFNVVKSQTMIFKMSNRAMWNTLKVVLFETPETYVLNLFNFITKHMLSILDIKKNPVTFFTTVVKGTTSYLMKTRHRNQPIFTNTLSSSGGFNIGGGKAHNAFEILYNNDLIEKSSKAMVTILEEEYEFDDEKFEKLYDKLEELGNIHSYVKIITFPIVQRVMDIPFPHLLSIPPKNAIMMGMFMKHLSKGVMDKKFSSVISFLDAYPKIDRTTGCPFELLNTKSDYTMRYYNKIIPNMQFLFDSHTMFGFTDRKLIAGVCETMIGVLDTCKKKVENIITGEPFPKVDKFHFEKEITEFFLLLYSNKLDGKFTEMRAKADAYF